MKINAAEPQIMCQSLQLFISFIGKRHRIEWPGECDLAAVDIILKSC